jgi:hypothetical protein
MRKVITRSKKQLADALATVPSSAADRLRLRLTPERLVTARPGTALYSLLPIC